MPEQNPGHHTFTGICVFRSNHIYVSAVADELTEKDEDHTLVFRWCEGKWAHRPLAFAVGALCHVDKPNPLVFAAGINGEVNIFTSPGSPGAATEQIDISEDGPSELVHLKSIRQIGKYVYVAGMARRVYRRIANNSWVPIDQGVFLSRTQRVMPVGFNALDGTSDNEIYAAGLKGEIWYFDGKRWTQVESPTNLALTCIRCMDDGLVYAAGLAGVLLEGRNRQWRVIDHGVTGKDFWGITVFNKKLYLANYEGVFVLENGNLSPVVMGTSRKLSTAYLDANDGVLWSVGQKDLAYTEDGSAWHEVERPN